MWSCGGRRASGEAHGRSPEGVLAATTGLLYVGEASLLPEKRAFYVLKSDSAASSKVGGRRRCQLRARTFHLQSSVPILPRRGAASKRCGLPIVRSAPVVQCMKRRRPFLGHEQLSAPSTTHDLFHVHHLVQWALMQERENIMHHGKRNAQMRRKKSNKMTGSPCSRL